MFDYEKLGAFYLGRQFDLASGQATPEVVMYDAKDLTTHAVIVGMTGSGKTGLGITLLEEAAVDGIPAIIIDPKGDLGNLMLTFPDLRTADFLPWIEPDEALRQGLSVEAAAAQRAQQWKAGLAAWDQSPDRIARLRDSANVAVYTPGSDAGLPLTILKSLDAPPPSVRADSDALRERIAITVSGLLTLLGIDADPLRSREHILLSNILEQAWRAGRDLDLTQLIREIQYPPFSRIGVLDLESIFPAADRLKLSLTINNVLASPSFASWTQGEPLDIQRLLYTDAGKPRLAILSISHLSEQERMFLVTLVCNEILTWVRSQPGTSSLRAILYMDEVFGYLPPTANPPSKLPLLTLLKQARAYGLGLVLATQNPADLDYKALSNAGTWFLGRLQTEQDKLRVLDGLEGASASAGVAFDRQRTEAILAGLKQRVFLLSNAHEDEPVVFQTRWSLSYLRGPLTRSQIQRLMRSRKPFRDSAAANVPASATERQVVVGESTPPILPPDVLQHYLAVARAVPRDAPLVYKPALLGKGRAHYVDARSRTDHWEEVAFLIVGGAEDGLSRDPWDDAEQISLPQRQDDGPESGARHLAPPAEFGRASSYKSWTSSFKNYLFRACPLTLNYCPELDLYSAAGERAGDFRAQLVHRIRERRDLEMEKLRRSNETAVARLKEKIRRADQRLEQERQQASSATMTAAMTFGSSVLGALFGRRKLSATNLNRAATSMRAAARAADQRSDIQRAQDNRQTVIDELQTLSDDFERQLARLKQDVSAQDLQVEEYEIRPRKSDLSAVEVSLLWVPYVLASGNVLEPAFDQDLFQTRP